MRYANIKEIILILKSRTTKIDIVIKIVNKTGHLKQVSRDSADIDVRKIKIKIIKEKLFRTIGANRLGGTGCEDRRKPACKVFSHRVIVI